MVSTDAPTYCFRSLPAADYTDETLSQSFCFFFSIYDQNLFYFFIFIIKYTLAEDVENSYAYKRIALSPFFGGEGCSERGL